MLPVFHEYDIRPDYSEYIVEEDWMKRAFGIILGCLFLAAGGAEIHAAEPAPLGSVHVAVRTGTIALLETAGTTPYYGVEIYKNTAPNRYIGTEIGYMREKGFLDSLEMGRLDNMTTFMPIEVNLKRVVDAGGGFCFGFGGGLSYNRIKYQATAISPFGPPGIPMLIQDVATWRGGGQLFVELNVAFGPVFVGVSVKGQVVATPQPVNSSGTYSYTDFSNWRAGGQLGLRF